MEKTTIKPMFLLHGIAFLTAVALGAAFSLFIGALAPIAGLLAVTIIDIMAIKKGLEKEEKRITFRTSLVVFVGVLLGWAIVHYGLGL